MEPPAGKRVRTKAFSHLQPTTKKSPKSGEPGGNGAWTKKQARKAAAKRTHVSDQKDFQHDISHATEATTPFNQTPEGKLERQKLFIEGLIERGTIAAGCRHADIDRKTYYNWIQAGGDFKEAVEAAFEIVADDLEEAGYERAKEKSDILLIFLLKGLRPKFRDNFKEGGGQKPEEEVEKQRVASESVRTRLEALRKRRGLPNPSSPSNLQVSKTEDIEKRIKEARSKRKVDDGEDVDEAEIGL